MYIPCQERIEIPDTNGTACTYCMKEKGHEGKHADIIVRAECEIVPEGPSLTETDGAYYFRVRRGDCKISIRVPKDDFLGISYTVNERVPTDPNNWHGVWGTNGPAEGEK